MPITPRQRKQRTRHIGSSDVAAILGHDEFRNAADVYYSKVGDLSPGNAGDNRAVQAGNYLEPGILEWAADFLDYRIRKNVRRVRGIFAANIDAMVIGLPELLEAKTAGLRNPTFIGEDWGPELSDEVPMRVMLQVQHQLYVTDNEVGWVPALLNGRAFQLYRVPRREGLIDEIVDRCTAFWEENVLAGVPPADMPPSLETIKHIERDDEDEEPATVPDDLMLAYAQAKDRYKQVKAERDELERQVLAALGDRAYGWSNVGSIAYKAQERRSLDTKRLKADHPELAKEYERVSTYRVPRLKVNGDG